MKQVYLAAAILALAVQTPRLVHAEEKEGMHHKMGEHSDEHFDAMVKKLKLTDDQKKTVKTAFDDKNSKMKALHEETGQKMKAIHEEYDSAVLAVLNDDQKKTYKEMMEKRKEKMEEYKDHKEKKDK